MLNKYKVVIILLTIIIFILFFSIGEIYTPTEKLDIASGIGVDRIKTKTSESFLVSMSVYSFNEEEIGSLMIKSSGNTIPDARSSRQLVSNNKFIYGLEKVIIISEATARKGIDNIVDILFSNQFMNDMAYVMICKDQAIDMLDIKIGDYPTSSDYIKGMMDNIHWQNFYSDENYKVMDMYVRIDAEGRELVLPYIEIIDDMPEITGTAIFKDGKMEEKVDIKDTIFLNMLREDKSKGIITLEKNIEEYISSFIDVKKKVTCVLIGNKENPELKFIIELDMKCDIISNLRYKKIGEKTEQLDKYEEDLEEYIEVKCNKFIKKMQTEYKVDCLELGKYAVAKYGRKKDLNLNEKIMNADIRVNVKVKTEKLGRGRYNKVE